MRPSTLFIYSLGITLMAFIFRDPLEVSVFAVPNILVGLYMGVRRYRILIILFLFGYLGLFINTLIVANTGDPVLTLYPLVIRSKAVNAFISIGLRLLSIAGATLIFLSLVEPYKAVKSLENDLRLPKGLAFSIYYALRLLPYIERASRDIMAIRRMRGHSGLVISPGNFTSILRQLLALLIERAVWTGVSIELRGFSVRKVRRTPYRLSRTDVIVFTLLLIQASLATAIYLLY